MLRPRTASAAALALLAAAALAGCSEPPEEVCPGTAVAILAFPPGARLAAGDAELGTNDPVPWLPDCPGQVGHADQLPGFQATLAFDAARQLAALCRRDRAVLLGARTGTRWAVEAATDGAALAACGTSCAAGLRVVVTGELELDGSGAATEFDGALVEIVTRAAGADCGSCLTDAAPACAARYLLGSSPDVGLR